MSRKSVPLVSLLALLSGAVASANCSHSPPASSESSSSSSSSSSSTGGPSSFQADPPSVYVAKVKNILLGLPPTDAEVQMVESDPTSFPALIDTWMAEPQYAAKMMRFFQLAFQQTQITYADFVNTIPEVGVGDGVAIPVLVQNAQESFARTVLQLNSQGAPLNQAMTTKQLMMTPALMELYAFLDTYHADDNAKIVDDFAKAYPTTIIEQEAAQGPIALTDSVDPTSPNFMKWYDPKVATLSYPTQPECFDIDPITYPTTFYTGGAHALHWLLFGAVDFHRATVGGVKVDCPRHGGMTSQLTTADFTTWKMVTLRPPNPGEKTTAFYDIPTLRTATELVINTPRPGFFSTPAFQANWPTNSSNQMRVTLNQALIVATGMFVDGTDPTMAPSTPGLDGVHAAPGTPCYGCHQSLDPTRSILASTYSWFYDTQTDPAYTAQKGLFVFQGVINTNINTIDDLATTLANHPLLPAAWAQKLCYWANSQACLPSDPEFQRVVKVFVDSKLSWNTLLRELLSSPLTTNASQTTTTQGAEVVAVSRRDHLCAALNNRLGFTDVCGITTPIIYKPTVIDEISGGLPSDGYGRGSATPVLPNQPTLFYRSGLENICEAVALQVIDPATPVAGVKTWASAGGPAGPIADFVATIMAITPSDERSMPAQAALQAHYTAALAMSGTSATTALQSTFVTACLSPSSLGIGM